MVPAKLGFASQFEGGMQDICSLDVMHHPLDVSHAMRTRRRVNEVQGVSVLFVSSIFSWFDFWEGVEVGGEEIIRRGVHLDDCGWIVL